MATITVSRPNDGPNYSQMPYGNAGVLKYTLQTNSSGAAIGHDSTSAIASGDVVRIGKLPAGLELHDSLLIVHDAFTASVVADIGFAYVDGTDDTGVPQDADYFGASVAINTAGRYRASNTAVAPVVLPKDAWLTITTGGANNAAVGKLAMLVYGEFVSA